MIELLERIRDSDVRLKGKLEFVNDWDYFTQGMLIAWLYYPAAYGV